MRKIMAALDIGNYNTKLVVGEMTKGKFNVLSVSKAKTLGYHKNNIISVDDLKETISSVIKDSESKLNYEIKKLVLSLPSYNVEFTIGEAKIKVNNEDNKIDGKSVTKVIYESYKGIIPDNMELISCVPMSFKLDNNEIVLDPKNKISTTLSVKCVIVMAPKSDVYKILSILDEMNIDVLEIALDSIGDYYYVSNDKLDKTRVGIINIGDYKTTVATFNKGVITSSSIIDLGSKNITNDIAYIYKVDLDTATKLKECYTRFREINSNDEINVKDRNDNLIKIKEKELNKVVYSRIKEILENSNKELSNLTKKPINHIIVTGGLSNIQDFNIILDEIFDGSASASDIKTIGVRNNEFSSAVGLIKWYNYIQGLKNKDYSIFTLKEQEELSVVHDEDEDNNNSVIGRFFSYFLDD